MKTAMQELLEDIKKHIEVEWPMNKSIRDSINKALEKEKEQLIDAWDRSRSMIDWPTDGHTFYNTKYNQNQ